MHWNALQAFGRRIPFAFLDDIRDKFLSAYGPEAAQYAVAYEYNTEFSGVLQQRMRYFANDPNADAINRVRGGVAEVKNIMVENIEKVCSLMSFHILLSTAQKAHTIHQICCWGMQLSTVACSLSITCYHKAKWVYIISMFNSMTECACCSGA